MNGLFIVSLLLSYSMADLLCIMQPIMPRLMLSNVCCLEKLMLLHWTMYVIWYISFYGILFSTLTI